MKKVGVLGKILFPLLSERGKLDIPIKILYSKGKMACFSLHLFTVAQTFLYNYLKVSHVHKHGIYMMQHD